MDDPVWAHVVREGDRAQFKHCRRAWDFGARPRQNLEPAAGPAPGLDDAVRDALAVYYYPGMWEWPRAIVEPLVREAFDDGHGGCSDDEKVTIGRALLERYFAWAPTVDHFTPVRVATDFEVEVPDPGDPARHLTATDGRPVRLRGRVDLLVIDADDVYWIVTHHLTTAGFASVDMLRLDEQAVTACWAWEQCFLGMRIAGTIANELQAGPARGGDRRRRPP